jgi:hypothetical protein
MRQMKNLWLAIALFVGSGSTLFGNGGAWQTGIPATGNASASKKDRHTDVTIENETLKIDLHPEYAAVEVRYRMHNTGPKVQQDFFFPVERWGANPDSDGQGKSDDIDHYQISVDGKELKSTNVAGPKEKSGETKEGMSEANPETARFLSRLSNCVFTWQSGVRRSANGRIMESRRVTRGRFKGRRENFIGVFDPRSS